MMRTRLLFAILVVSLVFVSCDQESKTVIDNEEIVNGNDDNGNGDNDSEPIDTSIVITEGSVVEHDFTRGEVCPLEVYLTDQEKSLLESGQAFAIELFKRDAQINSTQNTCISPLSIQVLLGLLNNGLKSDIANKMQEIMFGPDASVEAINTGFSKLSESLEATNCVLLSNAIWFKKGIALNNDFLNTGLNVYHATVKNLDFGNPQVAMDSICQWAYDNSYGLLKNLGIEVRGNTIMVLGNLVWFASAWKTPFDTHSTKPGKFTLADGSKKEVDMMQQMGIMSYSVLDKYKVLSLPFENNSFRMDFYVPTNGYTVDSIIPEIDWSAGPKGGGRVSLQMPKFTIGYSTDVRTLLSDLGMSELFNVGVFDRMTNWDRDSHLTQFKQDTKIKVEEGGVEAVAASTASYEPRGGSIYNFNIDRPFVYAIRDNATGSFLFMGRVNDI